MLKNHIFYLLNILTSDGQCCSSGQDLTFFQIWVWTLRILFGSVRLKVLEGKNKLFLASLMECCTTGERGSSRVCAWRVLAPLHERAHHLQLGLRRQEVGGHGPTRGETAPCNSGSRKMSRIRRVHIAVLFCNSTAFHATTSIILLVL